MRYAWCLIFCEKVLELIQRFLKQDILEDGVVTSPEGDGTPQGATLSPLLCNIYLNPLDHLMNEQGFEMVRYADDLVVVCRSLSEAERALRALEQWVKANGLPFSANPEEEVNPNPFT